DRRRARAGEVHRPRRGRGRDPEDELQGQPHDLDGAGRLQRDRRQPQRRAGHDPDPQAQAGGRVAEGLCAEQVRLPATQGLILDPGLVVQAVVSGLLFRGVYSLMAIRLPLIFGVMRVVNFAHADLMLWAVYLLWLFLYRSDLGRQMRAVADNGYGAHVIGTDVRHVSAVAFAVGAACVGAAGALVAPLLPFQPPTGLQLSVTSFNIVIIGGMGSV